MQTGISKKEEEIKTEENLEKYGIENEGPYGCGPISAWILAKIILTCNLNFDNFFIFKNKAIKSSTIVYLYLNQNPPKRKLYTVFQQCWIFHRYAFCLRSFTSHGLFRTNLL